MTFAVTNVAVSLGSNNVTAVLTDPFGRAATSTVAVTVRDAGYAYDANGNLTNDGERAYAWDEENRLIEVRDLASGQPLMRSRYDGLSRRRERVQWAGGVGTTNRYIYDGWNVLRVLDGVDNVLESYVHGPDLSGALGGAGGIGGILSVAHAGEPWRFYHADGNGNIALLTDEAEQESARLEYDPFGRVLIDTANQPVRYQFSSKEYDGTVGLNYYGYRFYSPQLGRWLSRDPLGDHAFLTQAMRGKSRSHRRELLDASLDPLYGFVSNDPLSRVDALGLATLAEMRCAVAKIGPCDALKAKEIADKATQDAESKYPNDSGKRNAYRHCLGSCESTRQLGRKQAEEVQKCHEDHGANPDPVDSAIDTHNNNVANDMAEQPWASCEAACDTAMERGDLITDPSDPRLGP